ncbi:hypothetical protein AHMF7605_06715 [Adhaeribacter arboris]|uniref:Sensor of ECF-type sigma factor n=1 Tax=Adhaeribacter arboris TaxID=2072846 RepID=A0A2T2YCJ4_9BACT|nr:hypothetical protein [Adhaeribacter arboris]PSR53242.1 hypothetical protein AHMF7605_06715 [Adhaeribacter arboris]
MKSKSFIITLFIFCTCLFAQAQTPITRSNGPNEQKRQERFEKIKTAKIAFLTDKLQLSSEQAQKFWPLYNEYEAERRSAHTRPRLNREANLTALSDQQLREAINEMHAVRQNELNVEKKYVDKFLKVISVRQLATLYQSEREFTHVLLKKLDTQRPRAYGRR